MLSPARKELLQKFPELRADILKLTEPQVEELYIRLKLRDMI